MENKTVYSDNNASIKYVNEFNTVVAAPKCRHMRDRAGLNLDIHIDIICSLQWFMRNNELIKVLTFDTCECEYYIVSTCQYEWCVMYDCAEDELDKLLP